MDLNVGIIIVQDIRGGIESENVPWNDLDERQYFESIMRYVDSATFYTTYPGNQNMLVMGRSTWQTIKVPYPGRANVILSKKLEFLNVNPDLYIADSFENLFEIIKTKGNIETVWFLGGNDIFKQAYKYCNKVVIITVPNDFYSETVVGYIIDTTAFTCVDSNSYNTFVVTRFSKIYNHNENQYLSLIKRVLFYGNDRRDRTIYGTKSLF